MDENDVVLYNIENSQTNLNSDLGITKEYNKANRDKLWDSAKGKKEFRDKFFDGKKVKEDTVTGKMLHDDNQAAKNKYGRKMASHHQAETDHTIPIKELHGQMKNNPFLSDADLKEIANNENNYAVISKNLNASKGKKSNIKVAMDFDRDISAKGRTKLVGDHLKATAAVNTAAAVKTAENMSKEFVSGAADTLESSAVILIADGVRHLVNVAEGKEDAAEALKSTAKTTMTTAAIGGANRLAATALNGVSNGAFSSVICSPQFGQAVALSVIVADAAAKYINGELDEGEFFEEITERGSYVAAGIICGEIAGDIMAVIGSVVPVAGTAAGKIAGQMLGIMITTAACSIIASAKDVYKHIDDYKIKEAKLRRLESEALAEMSRQREDLKHIIEYEYGKWDNTFREGFDMILSSACREAYASEGIAEGLDKILNVFGKSVAFKALDDYENQLDTVLVIKI